MGKCSIQTPSPGPARHLADPGTKRSAIGLSRDVNRRPCHSTILRPPSLYFHPASIHFCVVAQDGRKRHLSISDFSDSLQFLFPIFDLDNSLLQFSEFFIKIPQFVLRLFLFKNRRAILLLDISFNFRP
jgi:hypothetical protein